MSAYINKEGKLIIEIAGDSFFNPADEISIRRNSLLDMIVEHNSNDFIASDAFYGIVQLLKDTEPTHNQWKKALEIEPEE